jgi:hypothetical protein
MAAAKPPHSTRCHACPPPPPTQKKRLPAPHTWSAELKKHVFPRFWSPTGTRTARSVCLSACVRPLSAGGCRRGGALPAAPEAAALPPPRFAGDFLPGFARLPIAPGSTARAHAVVCHEDQAQVDRTHLPLA